MTKLPIVLRAAWLALLLLPLSVLARDRAGEGHLPLPVLDLERYAGAWHHLAWLPEDFQRKCVSSSRVEYLSRADGGFQVNRSCEDADGRTREETAEAMPVPGAPGSLQMRSAPRWRAWMPFGWSRRWVIAVDPDYRWALVGAPDRDRLWILARELSMEQARLDALVDQARGMGYPVDALVFAPGAGGGEGAAVPADLVVSTNEPFWQARVEEGLLQLSGPGLPSRQMTVQARGADAVHPGAQHIVAGDARGTVELQVVASRCQDSMSGAWFPLAATLSIDGAPAVAGCARPASMPPPAEMP